MADPKKKKSVSLDDQLSAMESSTNKRVKSMKNEFDDPSKPWNSPDLKAGAPKPKPTPPSAQEGGLNIPGIGRFWGRPVTKKKPPTNAKPGQAETFKGEGVSANAWDQAYEEQVKAKAAGGHPLGADEKTWLDNRVRGTAKAATEIEDPEFKRAFEEEKAITPDDEEGAKARAKKRSGR